MGSLCVSYGSGENRVSDVPFESGEDTMDGGDGVYEVIKVVRGDSEKFWIVCWQLNASKSHWISVIRLSNVSYHALEESRGLSRPSASSL